MYCEAFRRDRAQEVAGSSPASSTKERPAKAGLLFVLKTALFGETGLWSSERDVGGGDVLGDARGAARAADRDDVLALGEQPGQRQLGDRDALSSASRPSSWTACRLRSKSSPCQRGSIRR
jgi:hypothetical protein